MPVVSIRDLEEREQFPGFHGRFVHADTMTLVSWTVDTGSLLPEHAHPHEQVTYVLEGRFELTIGNATSVLEAGSIATIPSNVRHSGRALTRCRLLDAFHPVREDYQ